jgi:hypothetical protein
MGGTGAAAVVVAADQAVSSGASSQRALFHVSAAHELGRPAIAVIVSPRPDLDAMSDQDATDAGGCAATQNAEIIQAGTVEMAPGQLLRRDRDRDRPPW